MAATTLADEAVKNGKRLGTVLILAGVAAILGVIAVSFLIRGIFSIVRGVRLRRVVEHLPPDAVPA